MRKMQSLASTQVQEPIVSRTVNFGTEYLFLCGFVIRTKLNQSFECLEYKNAIADAHIQHFLLGGLNSPFYEKTGEFDRCIYST